MLVYIRKTSSTSHDYLIRARTNGIAVKFYVTVRRGLIQALSKLAQNFDIVVYSSLDKDMGDAIIDFIEQKLGGGKKLIH